MHVIVATDGSWQSLVAARQFMSFADPAKVDEISVVAVVSPLAAVPFANELGGECDAPARQGFRAEAESAARVVAAELQGWGVSSVRQRVLSGSPAAEIVRAAKESKADLIVVAGGSGGGLSDTILLGSTAQRVQHSAPCPVLVSRARR